MSGIPNVKLEIVGAGLFTDAKPTVLKPFITFVVSSLISTVD